MTPTASPFRKPPTVPVPASTLSSQSFWEPVAAGNCRDGRLHAGSNGVAGEWGHNTLPWMRPEEYPGFVLLRAEWLHRNMDSGTGLEADYHRATGVALKGPEITPDRAS